MKHAVTSVFVTVVLAAGVPACGDGGDTGGTGDAMTDSSRNADHTPSQDAMQSADEGAPNDAATLDDAHGDATTDARTSDAATVPVGDTIAMIALANIGLGACSTNTAGFQDYASSCTGNGGSPEYWCADFALWVWTQAGVDTDTLTAAAGSFYVYGQNHSTLHDTPNLGDVAVFDYTGGGVAQHVAIVTQVNADGTIETVSGDWDGSGSTEAAFSSTSHVVHNIPAYPDGVGTAPSVMGMTISGYVSPHPGTGCYATTRGEEMLDNACVQTSSTAWSQCDNGTWTDRYADPIPCNGVYPM